ncbi:MAG: DUF3526 domain-containing protein [Acidobacteria bacterium]|nr:DUF3526 domain-containing protein [Acidobacteriota bacterium]MYH21885.1 DUF3526 domain-containing protein [Acidobacteriota bacterium]MYK78588.1 DUF3526 domain-containing protein [Acidobacteriota bacterium]
MIRAIARKELVQYWRDGRVVTVFGIVALLGLAATVTGWSAVSAMERERASAVAMDREIWDTQGLKNPHTAAHFSRYAFQPTFNLAVFDPGLTDYVGNAIWLEAHYRDPAALRPVEDAVEIQRIAQLNPAWVIQVFGPLLIFILLYGAVAAERESGTLRQLLAAGMRPVSLLLGKAVSAFSLTGLLVFGVLLGSAFLMSAEGIERLPDTGLRTAALAALYLVYLAIFVFLALGVSALSSRSRTALAGLMGIWIVATILGPRIGPDVAGALAPAPSAPEFAARLDREGADPFWGAGEEAVQRRQRVMDAALAEYGVETVEELPINYDGYLLQASEEFANGVFDTMYAELWGGYERQHAIARGFALVSPTIAAQNVSMALAGTGLHAYRHFADEAEEFRREFVLLLNQEMIDHGGADGYAYVSGNGFWRQNPDFEYAAPGIGEAVRGVWADVIILLLWLAIAIAVAALGVRRGFLGEVAA